MAKAPILQTLKHKSNFTHMSSYSTLNSMEELAGSGL